MQSNGCLYDASLSQSSFPRSRGRQPAQGPDHPAPHPHKDLAVRRSGSGPRLDPQCEPEGLRGRRPGPGDGRPPAGRRLARPGGARPRTRQRHHQRLPPLSRSAPPAPKPLGDVCTVCSLSSWYYDMDFIIRRVVGCYAYDT
eukprot:scaffold497741_cov25-Prasinocladus_malaysianus.AAC.1